MKHLQWWPLCLALSAAAQPSLASGPACTVPGVLVSEGSAPPAFQGEPDPVPGHDAQGVYVAEPASGADGADKLVVTLKVDTLSPTAPPNTIYYVHFTMADGVERYLLYDPAQR